MHLDYHAIYRRNELPCVPGTHWHEKCERPLRFLCVKCAQLCVNGNSDIFHDQLGQNGANRRSQRTANDLFVVGTLKDEKIAVEDET